MAVREAAVAGSFYPRESNAIEKQLKGFFKTLGKEKKSVAVVAPHAGYIYSGKVAACAYNALKKAPSFVILGPNHTGLGSFISVSDAAQWQTPLGDAAVDEKLREKLLQKLQLEADDLAHIQEHSIEVQLPFLQFLFKNCRILPITISEHRLDELIKLGNALASLHKSTEFSLIASSDFSHFIPLQEAKQRDKEAIKKIEEMDIEGFYNMVQERNMSICGFAPIVATMQFCKQLGIKKAKLLRYDTSAATTGDEISVVGYAALRFG